MFQEEEITSLTQALIKEDAVLDKALQPSESKIVPIDEDGSSSDEPWNPDKDSGSDNEEQNEWYRKLVQDYFVGSEQNFAKARELYKIVQQSRDSKIAVFYKLKDKNIISDAFDKIERLFIKWLLDEVSQDFKSNEFHIEALQDRLREASNNPEAKEQDKKIVASLLENTTKIKNFFLEKEINKQNIEKMFETLKLKEIILEEEYKKFFNVNMTQEEMKTTGALYCPGVLHCWGTNLSWVLGHIKKGSKFLIGANIVDNKYRRTINNQQEHSAFLREICIALRVGYTLSSIDGKMTLQPLGLSEKHLENLDIDTTAKPGNGINPSHEEIEFFFATLEPYIRSGQDFKYKHETLELQKARLCELSTKFVPSTDSLTLPLQTDQTPQPPSKTVDYEKEERNSSPSRKATP